MKKKNLKSLTLNKKIISDLFRPKIKGGLETHEINCYDTDPTADSYNECPDPSYYPCSEDDHGLLGYTYRVVDCIDTEPRR